MKGLLMAFKLFQHPSGAPANPTPGPIPSTPNQTTQPKRATGRATWFLVPFIVIPCILIGLRFVWMSVGISSDKEILSYKMGMPGFIVSVVIVVAVALGILAYFRKEYLKKSNRQATTNIDPNAATTGTTPPGTPPVPPVPTKNRWFERGWHALIIVLVMETLLVALSFFGGRQFFNAMMSYDGAYFLIILLIGLVAAQALKHQKSKPDAEEQAASGGLKHHLDRGIASWGAILLTLWFGFGAFAGVWTNYSRIFWEDVPPHRIIHGSDIVLLEPKEDKADLAKDVARLASNYSLGVKWTDDKYPGATAQPIVGQTILDLRYDRPPFTARYTIKKGEVVYVYFGNMYAQSILFMSKPLKIRLPGKNEWLVIEPGKNMAKECAKLGITKAAAIELATLDGEELSVGIKRTAISR